MASHFSPAVRFLGFSLQVVQMNQSIRCERGQKGGVLKTREVALRGSRVLKEVSFSELDPREAEAWRAGCEESWPRKEHLPQGQDTEQGQGVPPVQQVGATTSPVHHLRFVRLRSLQAGAVKEAGHL